MFSGLNICPGTSAALVPQFVGFLVAAISTFNSYSKCTHFALHTDLQTLSWEPTRNTCGFVRESDEMLHSQSISTCTGVSVLRAFRQRRLLAPERSLIWSYWGPCKSKTIKAHKLWDQCRRFAEQIVQPINFNAIPRNILVHLQLLWLHISYQFKVLLHLLPRVWP